MPTYAAVIQYGDWPTTSLPVDEVGILVKSFTMNFSREEETGKGATTRAVQRVKLTNPLLVMDYEAEFNGVTTGTGNLQVMHPGTSVASLANFAATKRGFAITDGTMIFYDPKDKYVPGEAPATTFQVKQFPYVVAP